MPGHQRQVRLNFVNHQVIAGNPGGRGEAIMILVYPGDEPEEFNPAVLLACPHAADRLVEQLREARASAWPHHADRFDETDSYHVEEVAPDVRVTLRGGDAAAEAGAGDDEVLGAVRAAIARHERSARQLRLWSDAAARSGIRRP